MVHSQLILLTVSTLTHKKKMKERRTWPRIALVRVQNINNNASNVTFLLLYFTLSFSRWKREKNYVSPCRFQFHSTFISEWSMRTLIMISYFFIEQYYQTDNWMREKLPVSVSAPAKMTIHSNLNWVELLSHLFPSLSLSQSQLTTVGMMCILTLLNRFLIIPYVAFVLHIEPFEIPRHVFLPLKNFVQKLLFHSTFAHSNGWCFFGSPLLVAWGLFLLLLFGFFFFWFLFYICISSPHHHHHLF